MDRSPGRLVGGLGVLAGAIGLLLLLAQPVRFLRAGRLTAPIARDSPSGWRCRCSARHRYALPRATSAPIYDVAAHAPGEQWQQEELLG